MTVGPGNERETLKRLISTLVGPALRTLAHKAGVSQDGDDSTLRIRLEASRLTLSSAVALLTPDVLRGACAALGIDPSLPRSDLIAALIGADGRHTTPRPAKLESVRDRLLQAANPLALQSMLGQTAVGRMVDDEVWKLRGLVSSLTDLSAPQIASHMTDAELRTLSPDASLHDRRQILMVLGIEPESVDVEMDLVSVDVETADEHADSICSIGLVCVINRVIARRALRVIRPPRRVKDLHARVHGITEQLLDSAPDLQAAWPELSGWLTASPMLLAHNAAFERRVLGAACSSVGASIDGRWVCTLQLARRTWELESHSLDNVCRYLGIGITHHNALSDAEAALRVFLAARLQSKLLA